MSTSPEYLLDTTCIRQMKDADTEAAKARNLRVVVSPMSVWELLSHFEDGKNDFERYRAWLRKARHCDVLDHPVAEQLAATGVDPFVPRQPRSWRG